MLSKVILVGEGTLTVWKGWHCQLERIWKAGEDCALSLSASLSTTNHLYYSLKDDTRTWPQDTFLSGVKCQEEKAQS